MNVVLCASLASFFDAWFFDREVKGNESMKTKSATLLLAFSLIFSTLCVSGCSGWSVKNPFARTPKAEGGRTPEGLDDLDDLTPPPENYTTSDARSTDKSAQLAQKGKYEADSDSTRAEQVAMSNEKEEPSESFRTPDYSRSYQDSSASNASTTYSTDSASFAANVPDANAFAPGSAANAAAAQNYVANSPVEPTPAAETLTPYVPAQNNASYAVAPTAAQNYEQAPYVPNPSLAQTAPIASSTPNLAQDAYAAPVANYNLAPNANPYPIAQVSGAAAQTPATHNDFDAASMSNAQNALPNDAVNVALNYDQASDRTAFNAATNPAANAPNGNAYDSDPYSNVFYERQTTSGGFAPGSVTY